MVKAAAPKETDSKKKPSWRAIETSKALVLRPSTKGTRVSELHLKIPKTTESAGLFKLKGSALLDRVAKLINDHSEPAPRMALRENPLVFVKWSMRGNLVLKCSKPMDDLIKEGIKDAIAYFFPSPSAEIMILNKPPTTALKFLAVPRHNLDGSDTDEMDLLNDLTAHSAWANVELWSNPKFINLKAGMAGATVVVSVIDDNQGNVGPRLMGTMVDFSGCTRPCKRHMSTSHECPFWIGRTSKERHAELYAEIEAKFPRKDSKKDKNAAASRQTLGRKKVGFSGPDADGFVQVGAAPGIARIDTVPESPSPAPPDSIKPASGSILGALADEALRPELQGNEEARRLMQETLLDEAAFAAADAASNAGSGNEAKPTGSPPSQLEYV
ncbi:hypothetical protein AX14_006605 [Amanita brunnescens Koide BX004]|nr:hypothetical protein AX14_006605 [Amanita brunnescens Koide BX004]